MTDTGVVGPPVERLENGSPPRRGLNRVDAVLSVLLAAGVLVVHDVGYLLRVPYWTDEAWVALTTRFPLGELPSVTCAAPVGFTALLRLAPDAGQRLRLVPLGFAALSVVAAYALAREAGWGRPRLGALAGVLAGTAVLLSRSSLVRDDLKQFTADAFFALLLLALTARLEASWTRRRLAVLGGTTVIGMLFSAPAGFVGAAVFLSLALTSVRRSRRERLQEVLVAGAVTAAGLIAVFAVFYVPTLSPGLTDYWRASYPPVGDPSALATFLHTQLLSAVWYVGLGPWYVLLPLLVAGLLWMARAGRPAVSTAVVVLLLEMFALGAAHKYPFLDLRTSHFLLSVVGAVAAVGVVGLLSWSPVRPPVALVLGVLLVAAFVLNVHSLVRAHPIPPEDVRVQTEYVAAQRAPADVVLVNSSSIFGFSYYWPDTPRREPSDVTLQHYVPAYPASARIVMADDFSSSAVSSAVRRAVDLAGGGGRVWLVLDHLHPGEREGYFRGLRDAGGRITEVHGAGLLLRVELPSA